MIQWLPGLLSSRSACHAWPWLLTWAELREWGQCVGVPDTSASCKLGTCKLGTLQTRHPQPRHLANSAHAPHAQLQTQHLVENAQSATVVNSVGNWNKSRSSSCVDRFDAKEANYVWNTLEVFIAQNSGSKKLQTAFKITKHEKHDILGLQCDEYRQNFSFSINFWENFLVGSSLFFSWSAGRKLSVLGRPANGRPPWLQHCRC